MGQPGRFSEFNAAGRLIENDALLRPRCRNYQSCGNQIAALPSDSWDNRSIMEISSLDLSYRESDPTTKQPSACIYLKAIGIEDFAGIKAEKLVTVPCLSFIELDAEIRRLHAELDEIRARAKKKFYKADAAAVGAS